MAEVLAEGLLMKMMPELKKELCNNCRLCVIACHGGALVPGESGISVRPTDKCDYCGVCEAVCPTGALSCPYTITRPGSTG
jgi:MinD superfamily P-loop ATPase